MSEVSLERRYARALFDLSEERKAEDKWLGQLQEIAVAFQTFRELSAVLLNRFIDLQKRYRVAEDLTARLGTDREVLNFLKLLIDRKRLAQFPGIVTAFEAMVDRKLGRVQVDVRSAKALNPELMNDLKSALKTRLGQEVKTAARVDTRLIGGFQLAWQGKLYDGSVKGRLDGLHKKLAG